MPLRALSRCVHVTSGPAAVGGVSHRSVATHCHRRSPVAKKIPLLRVRSWGRVCSHAGVAELADAYGSGPYESNLMKVQLLSPAPLHADASWSNPEAFFVGSSRRKCPGPRTSRDGESAPQILGYLRFLLNWANVVAKVPRRFWGTKRAGGGAREARAARGAGISATEGAR